MSSDITVIYHYEDGSWWADSPDIDRWSAAAPSLEELIALVSDGVPFALENDALSVTHVPAADLRDVFAGRTAGARVRLELLDSSGQMIESSDAVNAAPGGSPNVLVAA